MIVTKKKPKMDMTLIDSLVRSYLEYIKLLNRELTCGEISEIMRYSMCRAQGLDTKGYSKKVEQIGEGASARLYIILEKAGMLNKSLDVKKGLLEACVHCMEMSRKRVMGVS